MMIKKTKCKYGIDREFVCSGSSPSLEATIEYLNSITY